MGDSVKAGLDANELEVAAETVKPKAKKSVSYALKAFKQHVETLKENKLLDSGDERAIMERYKKAAKKHIEQEYGL